MKHPYTLEIALPVYNEEKNIIHILKDIYRQNRTEFTLTNVSIYLDGSTDTTYEILKKNRHAFPLLTIHKSSMRMGKLYRLNQIYRHCHTHALVILDADIALVGDNFLDSLIAPLKRTKSIQLVSAKEIPICPKTFFGRIMYHSFTNWDYVYQSVPHYDTVHSLGGSAIAYRGSFAKTLSIPEHAKEERIYLFLKAKNVKGYYYNTQSCVRYLPVSTFKDFQGLLNRSFGETDKAIDEYFGFETNSIIKIPYIYKFIGISKAIARNPFFAVLAIVFNIVIANYKNKHTVVQTQLWEFSESTKQSIRTYT